MRLLKPIYNGKVILMANKANSLSHTKWVCKYHIVFTPKYRRKIIYNQYKESIRDGSGESIEEITNGEEE